MKNIYFCGFMGCGKTTVARHISRRLQIPAYDLDQLIVEHCGMPIPQIFEKYGEAYFRQVETEVLKSTQDLRPAVFATGGGILTNPENGKVLQKLGTLIYLKTPFSLCYQRIKGDQNRPLAISKSREELLKLYQGRDAVYRQYAHHIIHCGNNVKAVMEKVLELSQEI